MRRLYVIGFRLRKTDPFQYACYTSLPVVTPVGEYTSPIEVWVDKES